MTDFTFADMEAIVRASLSTPPAGRLTGAETLAELGVDSLTVLNVIMAAADRFAIDLDALDAISSLPPTVGGLHEMLAGLSTACAAP